MGRNSGKWLSNKGETRWRRPLKAEFDNRRQVYAFSNGTLGDLDQAICRGQWEKLDKVIYKSLLDGVGKLIRQKGVNSLRFGRRQNLNNGHPRHLGPAVPTNSSKGVERPRGQARH